MTEDANTSDLGGDVPTGRAKGRKGEPALSAAQKALRDSAIVASLHAGVEVREVAKQFQLTPRSVKRIAEAFELRPTAVDQRPMQIVERVLRTYEEQMRNFALVAHDTLERAPAVAISALKAQADALERYSLLLADVGKLPDNLEIFRAEEELRRMARLMSRKMAEVARGELSAVEAAEFFRGVLRSGVTIEGEAFELELEPGEAA